MQLPTFIAFVNDDLIRSPSDIVRDTPCPPPLLMSTTTFSTPPKNLHQIVINVILLIVGAIEPSNVQRFSPLRVGFATVFSRNPCGAAAKEEKRPTTLTTTTIAYDGEHPHRRLTCSGDGWCRRCFSCFYHRASFRTISTIVRDVDWMRQNPFC